MEKTEVVAKIIEYVGGKDNVVNTWHCMTRLRFELKDTSKIQEDAIKALDGVIGVQFAKGQLQIVLGTSVHKYYDIALQMLDLKEDIAAPAQPEKKKDFISWFMDMVSGVFGPIVPAIAGAGMIKVWWLWAWFPMLPIPIRSLICLPAACLPSCRSSLPHRPQKNSRPTSIWPLPLPPL